MMIDVLVRNVDNVKLIYLRWKVMIMCKVMINDVMYFFILFKYFLYFKEIIFVYFLCLNVQSLLTIYTFSFIYN